MGGSRLVAAGLAALLLAVHAAADEPAELYSAHTIVTGQGEANRLIGFRDCLGKALAKVSGDPTVTTAAGFDALLPDAARYVESFRYRDLLEGVPIHDEQGTYDRPHDLTCIYRPAALDPLLASLKRRPWLAERPTLALLLDVTQPARRFTLSADGSESPYMRESLTAAAETMAIPVALPARAALGSLAGQAATAGGAETQALLRAASADMALKGTLDWSDKDLGWVAVWHLEPPDGKPVVWQVRGVSFDEAFRNAVRGAAKILSGNGKPKDEP